MIPELSKDLREFVELLVAHQVEFVVVGSFALAFHGHPRYTKDIDFFVRSSFENAEKLTLLIREFGFEATGLQVEDFYDPDVVVQLGYEPNRIDILTHISGATFDQVWTNRISGHLGGVPVAFISRHGLVVNERASARPQDLVDAETVDFEGDGV